MADQIAHERPEPFVAWFREWEGYVRSRDFAAARGLFDARVASFGTHAAIVIGIDALESQQWQAIWPRIADFRFVVEQLHGRMDGDFGWAAVPWTSTGFHENGAAFERPGRATVAFRRDGGRWLGVHTHFSLKPGIAQRTYGAPTRGSAPR